MAVAEPPVRIRTATREDVPDIVRLLSRDALGSEREVPDEPLPGSYFAAFEEISRSENDELLVAEDDGGILGTMQLTFLRHLTHRGGLRLQIEAVRVDESRRGSGIGGEMISHAITRARERDCHLAQLTTNRKRLVARRFYERLGFVASHEGMKLDLAP